MPKIYSLDFREKVVNCIKNGDNFSQTAKKFGITHVTARRWFYMDLKGSIKDPEPKVRNPKKLNPEDLKKYVNENPDKTVKQLAEHFGVWYQAVYYRLNQLGYTYKKRLSLRREMQPKEEKVS